ncbi:MAG TPA: hypothetical protein VEW48_17230 [Thermoanaerobaculia bacterium]|nr:hypothetical protein [Thermoanaerobaculia bacterium]
MYREPDFSNPRLAAAPECRFEPAPADTVLPDGFMSTTNHPTYVKIGGRWRMPERPRMDAHLVWDPAAGRLAAKEFRMVCKGDLVAVAVKAADAALYQSKAAGRDRVTSPLQIAG